MLREVPPRMAAILFWVNVMLAATEILVHAWQAAPFNALAALIFAGLWWRGRKRKRRAPRFAGYKARARLAALVRKARESAQPRRVLRPVPGGAR